MREQQQQLELRITRTPQGVVLTWAYPGGPERSWAGPGVAAARVLLHLLRVLGVGLP